MEMRPERRHISPPPHGVNRRTRSHLDSDGVDRISALPDDLLLQILVRLGCARTAASTSLLSRRWESLWTNLTELIFRDVAPRSLVAALARDPSSPVSLLDIRIPKQHQLGTADVYSLLRAGARLSPREFVLTLPSHLQLTDRYLPIDLPYFHRTSSIELAVRGLIFKQPSGGEFTKLERVSLLGCYGDLGALVTRCPRLCVLMIAKCKCRFQNFTVHSASLQELVVKGCYRVSHVDIVAPVVRKLRMSVHTGMNFSLSMSAPMVEKLSWRCWYDLLNVGIGQLWRLKCLNLRTVESQQQGRLPREHILSLRLVVEAKPAVRTFVEEIEKLPVTNFSILKLRIATMGHVFGAVVLHLLGIHASIQRLKMLPQKSEIREACPVNCPCGEPDNWRSQTISFTSLEEVEIEGLKGEDDELDFLGVLFRCGPMLKKITLELSDEVTPSDDRCKKICNVLNANSSVKCKVYLSSGKDVLTSECMIN